MRYNNRVRTRPNNRRSIKKILVANRGEIAIRIFRACTELGLGTVAIYSHEDRHSLHRYKADEAYQIGSAGNPVRSYLDISEVIRIAQMAGADAIHPGYGFLSERVELQKACEQARIVFIGPDEKALTIAGDKVKTLALAKSLRIPTVPGSTGLASLQEAKAFAKKAGYPLIFKASFGGGGRGMRVVRNEKELANAFVLASTEAEAAFGKADLYLEKYVQNPKHLEVQLLGDGRGNVVHLFERDCSVQRRHQKVIECAPAVSITPAVRANLFKYATTLGKALRLRSASTAEFLLDTKGKLYFIEINPRIQVEHTVTEEITGIDLIQSQIKIAGGKSLRDLGLTQDKVSQQGVAIQCRITTEDPVQSFKPDSGKLVTYRSASGFGIRLDAGSAFTGAVISPFYDSLLVKVTARGRDQLDASRKLRRCLSEFRIRGVRNNIQFLEKILAHKSFLQGNVSTTFIDETPALFEFTARKDRANRILHFLADVSINGHELMRGIARPVLKRSIEIPALTNQMAVEQPPSGWRDRLLKLGKKRFLKEIREHDGLLITDTTLRDAHQSLLATRVRSYDMLQVARQFAFAAPQIFSLEMWGGATFDVCLRFLKEDPWERLARIREAAPNILLQMLIRGANILGYSNYPKNLVEAFVAESASAGIDIFRIFDCFNNLPQMLPAINAVKKTKALAEVALCYTGDVLQEEQKGASGKFTLRYYSGLVKQFEKAGADIIAIKDMAGLLRPMSALALLRALRDVTNLPIHLHTHDTAGGQIATYLKAAEADVDIVDCALSSMSGVTSQPSLEGLVATLENTDRDTGLDLLALNPFGAYWEGVRDMYAPFESDLRSATGEVYLTEIPGGQYSNFRPQAEALGVGNQWAKLKHAYAEINTLLGGIIKVTPSSKVVGDLAIFMVANNLSTTELVERASELNFPSSVVELFQGDLGIPYGGFPEELRAKVLKGKAASKQSTPPRANIEAARKTCTEILGHEASVRDALSYLLFPHVVREYADALRQYGDLSKLPTPAFFYGLKEGEEISVDIEKGKRLYISLVTISEPGEDGMRTVFFELNGQSRSIEVRDKKIAPKHSGNVKADPKNTKHVGAPLAGALVAVAIKQGDLVKRDQKLFVIEAMKMQSAVSAPTDGKVSKILVNAGNRVEAGDLIVELI